VNGKKEETICTIGNKIKQIPLTNAFLGTRIPHVVNRLWISHNMLKKEGIFMSERTVSREFNEERVEPLESQNNLIADIFSCRDLLVTSLDMLVDMRSNGNDVATKRDMAVDCLDSAIAKLNDMLERYV